MAVEFSANFESLARQIETLPDKGFKKLRPAFTEISATFIKKFREKRLSGRPGLYRRSEALSNSFKFFVSGSTTESLKSFIYSGSKYARIHEFGGVIKPKTKPYLVFKLNDVAGVALSASGGSWRRAKQVTIPKRLGFMDYWQSIENQRMIEQTLSRAMQSAINEVKNG